MVKLGWMHGSRQGLAGRAGTAPRPPRRHSLHLMLAKLSAWVTPASHPDPRIGGAERPLLVETEAPRHRMMMVSCHLSPVLHCMVRHAISEG